MLRGARDLDLDPVNLLVFPRKTKPEGNSVLQNGDRTMRFQTKSKHKNNFVYNRVKKAIQPFFKPKQASNDRHVVCKANPVRTTHCCKQKP